MAFYGRGPHDFKANVDLGKAPSSSEPVDVLLLFDCTESMKNVLDEARERAAEIVGQVKAKYTDVAFGVASLADYGPGGAPWVLHQQFVTDSGRVISGLQALGMRPGFDVPEAYSRALYESRLLSWRPKARKYLILFGDAPAHDPNFYGKDMGIDPGRDGIPGTADDLRFRSVVAALAADSIAVIAVYDGSSAKPMRAETRMGFDYMARETRGLSIPISKASEVPRVIIAGIRRMLEPPPVAAVPERFRDWVNIGAMRRQDSLQNVFSTSVVVTVPRDEPNGIYRIPLAVSRPKNPENAIGFTWITVRVGLLYYPWKWPVTLLWLALPSVFMMRRLSRRGAVRLERNRQWWFLLARALIAIMACAGVWAIRRFVT